MSKDFGLFFLVLSSATNLKWQLVMVQKVFWQLLWKLWDHFCNTYEVVENTTFSKKGNCFCEKNYLNSFSSFAEYDRPQRKIYGGPEGILAIVAEVLISIL